MPGVVCTACSVLSVKHQHARGPSQKQKKNKTAALGIAVTPSRIVAGMMMYKAMSMRKEEKKAGGGQMDPRTLAHLERMMANSGETLK